MAYYILKTVVTVILIVAISEIAKRSTLLGGIFASVPLISVLAMIWLYVDTRDAQKVASLATSVFWLVLPSLSLFLVLPLLLKKELNFWLSLGTALAVMVGCYYLMLQALARFGIRL